MVHLTLTFLQWQLHESGQTDSPLRSVAEVIQRHRRHHAREVLIAACEQAIADGHMDSVVERFITSTQVAA